jgi:hypothetical protein
VVLGQVPSRCPRRRVPPVRPDDVPWPPHDGYGVFCVVTKGRISRPRRPGREGVRTPNDRCELKRCLWCCDRSRLPARAGATAPRGLRPRPARGGPRRVKTETGGASLFQLHWTPNPRQRADPGETPGSPILVFHQKWRQPPFRGSGFLPRTSVSPPASATIRPITVSPTSAASRWACSTSSGARAMSNS